MERREQRVLRAGWLRFSRGRGQACEGGKWWAGRVVRRVLEGRGRPDHWGHWGHGTWWRFHLKCTGLQPELAPRRKSPGG